MKPEKLVIEKLANGIIELSSIRFSEKVMSIAKELIVDVSGAILAGSSTNSVRSIFEVASEIYPSGKCNVIGRTKSLNPSGAAFVNGASAHSLEFDDNCYAGVVHGSAVVFPAVLAFAQFRALSGLDLLRSFIIGLEVEFAVAKAFSNSIYDTGWWTTSVLGSIGSAAGVASLTNANIREIENALSLAIALAMIIMVFTLVMQIFWGYQVTFDEQGQVTSERDALLPLYASALLQITGFGLLALGLSLNVLKAKT